MSILTITRAPSPGERCDLTVIFIDIVGSTAMKMSLPEGAVNDQILWFQAVVEAAVESRVPGALIKPVGDGALVFIESPDLTLEAIQVAVDVQETIDDSSQRVDGAMGRANFAVSIAVTTGVASRIEIQGRADYLGYVIDKSQRLSAAASPNALFIDPATYAATNLRRVTSSVGAALRRAPEDYVGTREQITVKGVAGPVDYFEVLWGRQLYGVRSEFVSTLAGTDSTPDSTEGPSRPTVTALPSQRYERHGGQVKTYDASKGFGFIAGYNGEDFFTAPSLLMYPEDVDRLADGQKVAFVAAEPSVAGRARRASALLVDGTDADGHLVNLTPERGFGWLRVKNDSGLSIDVFVSANDIPAGVIVGSAVTFQVNVTPKGPRAVQLEAASGQSAA